MFDNENKLSEKRSCGTFLCIFMYVPNLAAEMVRLKPTKRVTSHTKPFRNSYVIRF